jgi:NADPH-dependent 2,4-dienoyl-CoA reductase/sulfur reductase-like enzyme/nitrite reductase/ring-hydroxylating ferredoxin subunit
MSEPIALRGPDAEKGVAVDQLPDGIPVAAQFRGEPIVLVRRGGDVFAVAAGCTHYGARLDEGAVSGDTLRCPWHHACFSLRSGDALAAPALNPIACYRVERAGGTIRVLGQIEEKPAARRTRASDPSSVVIIGGGAAGSAAAEMLRREGYGGPVTILSEDPSVPYDRPNLSKDYLAGTAPEEWIPLRPREFYQEQNIDLRTGTIAAALDAGKRVVTLTGGEQLPFDALLLATGGRPRRLPIPGADLEHVYVLRSLSDGRSLIERSQSAKRAVVIGAGFIGLEVAASLRARGLDVHVVAPDKQPLERVLGPQLGQMIRVLHESHGVRFHLGQTPASIDEKQVVLSDGSNLAADLVVMGAGITPDTTLAEGAGLALDRGVKVSAFLETSAPAVYAAGDIARWPDPHSGQAIRVEHWVVAQRQGQTAARNMLGAKVAFEVVPFFWSAHYDVTIAYVGHAEGWDRIEVDGNLDAHDGRVAYWKNGKRLAVATVGRDKESLLAEIEMEAAVRSSA